MPYFSFKDPRSSKRINVLIDVEIIKEFQEIYDILILGLELSETRYQIVRGSCDEDKKYVIYFEILSPSKQTLTICFEVKERKIDQIRCLFYVKGFENASNILERFRVINEAVFMSK